MGSELALNIVEGFNQELLDCRADNLADFLDSPTLFDLTLGASNPLFVSTLLHGNETSGWDAMSRLLRDGVPCPLILFIGNVQAARDGRRSQPHGVDFNRIWSNEATVGSRLAAEVIDYIRPRKPWFALDIHNNSGPNPHYSVITNLDSTTLDAASRFSDKAIYATQPNGVITRRTQPLCPSIAIEVGMSNDPASAERAYDYLRLLTTEQRVPAPHNTPLKLYRSKYRVEVEHSHADVLDGFPQLNEELDYCSFEVVREGQRFATIVDDSWTFRVRDDDATVRTGEFLSRDASKIRFKKDVIISMYTRNAQIALEDCVCYFLEEFGPADV